MKGEKRRSANVPPASLASFRCMLVACFAVVSALSLSIQFKLHHEAAQRPTQQDQKMAVSPRLNERVQIVYAVDKNGLLGLEASIRSVRAHASEDPVIHIIGAKDMMIPFRFPDAEFYDLSKVSEQYNLSAFENPHIGERFKRLNSHANYVRLILPWILPNLSKVMWLDTDTVVQCDIVPIFRNALSSNNYAFAAFPHEGQQEDVLKIYSLGLTGTLHTFNGGIFVVDLYRWRERKMTETMLMFAERNRKDELYKLGTQTLMHLAVQNEFEELNQTWVAMDLGGSKGVDQKKLRGACFLHWSGGRKPWLKKGMYKQFWKPYASMGGGTAALVPDK